VLAWDGPVLTDSGGYQVFSLAARRCLDADGVTFRSHLDGSPWRLTPESAIQAQARFGVDVAMVLDECPAHGASGGDVAQAVERSVDWAHRGLAAAAAMRGGGWQGGVFAIQQGGLDAELRAVCADRLRTGAFDGFAIGGLAVGEPQAALHDGVSMAAPMLPSERPRYLMGVGYPEDLLQAIACGVDLFDCVLPTRSARTGKVFTSRGEIVIKNARWADDPDPLDPDCGCPTCARYPRAVLRHLFISGEVTSVVLLTIHNLAYYLSLMREARAAILTGRYSELRRRLEAARRSGGADPVSADSMRGA
jgi:queuine tRNA-ribosyltransferase